jgi:hypothetical protein
MIKKVFKIEKNNLTRIIFFSTLLIGLVLIIYSSLPIVRAATELYDPLGGVTITGFGQKIISWFLDLAVPLTAIMTIWGAILLMSAGGDPKKIKQGQDALTSAVVGLAVVMIIEGLFSFSIKTIEEANNVSSLLQVIERYLLLIGGPIAIIMFLYGGFLMGTGTPDNIKKAKNVFIWTSVALGIISVFSVSSLISLINQLAK